MGWFSGLVNRFSGTGKIEAAATIKNIGVGETSTAVRLIQNALVDAGHVLVIDNEFGPITESAVRVFQAASGLPVTGFVDIFTARKLDSVPKKPIIPVTSIVNRAPWLSELRAITGVREVPGAANSPIIMSWKQDIAKFAPEMQKYTNNYTGDAIAWCGLGEAGCMVRAKVHPPFGRSDTDRFLWALSWKSPNWGTGLSKPVVGSIATFRRSGGGHVATVEKIQGDTIWIRGCNQSDTVNVVKRSLDSSFVAATWPPGWPIVDNIPGDISNAVPQGRES